MSTHFFYTSLINTEKRNVPIRKMVGKKKYTTEQIMQWKKIIRNLGTQHISKKRAYGIISAATGVPARTIETYTSPGRYRSPSRYLNTKYKYLTRRLNKLLPQFFNGNTELSLAELTDRIESNVGIAMRETTLEKLLGKYEGTERGSPLVKTESGNYYLSEAYYRRNGKE